MCDSYFVHSHNNVQEYVMSLSTSEMAIYDRAMGTLIQNNSMKNSLKEEVFCGEES